MLVNVPTPLHAQNLLRSPIYLTRPSWLRYGGHPSPYLVQATEIGQEDHRKLGYFFRRSRYKTPTSPIPLDRYLHQDSAKMRPLFTFTSKPLSTAKPLPRTLSFPSPTETSQSTFVLTVSPKRSPVPVPLPLENVFIPDDEHGELRELDSEDEAKEGKSKDEGGDAGNGVGEDVGEVEVDPRAEEVYSRNDEEDLEAEVEKDLSDTGDAVNMSDGDQNRGLVVPHADSEIEGGIGYDTADCTGDESGFTEYFSFPDGAYFAITSCPLKIPDFVSPCASKSGGVRCPRRA